MSLSKLPEELVAQVASHLDYEDVSNFMESSWRNYHVVKRYKRDKIKLNRLDLEISRNGTIKHTAYVNRKKYTFNKFNLHEPPIAKLKKMLEQIFYIDSFVILHLKITKDFVQMLMATKTKIGTVRFFMGETVELSAAEFIELCQKFDICLDDVELERTFCTDEVLCQILPHTMVSVGRFRDCRNAITDRTLEALTGENEIKKSRLELFRFRTSFTIKGILKAFEKVRDKKMDEVYWDLGILHSDQSADAMQYFENGDFGHYKVEVSDNYACKKYEVHNRFSHLSNILSPNSYKTKHTLQFQSTGSVVRTFLQKN